MISETGPDGVTTYTYDAQNRLVKGELADGQYSEYTYNALGARIQNVQYRINANAGHQNAPLSGGSIYMREDYDPTVDGNGDYWQRGGCHESNPDADR